MTRYKHTDVQGSATVTIGRRVPLDEGWEDLEVVQERIRKGRALLEIVEYPWGVELDLVNVVGRP